MTQSHPGPVWFIDTSSLLSMAVHPDVKATVLKAIGAEPVLVTDAEIDELDFRKRQPESSDWATTALSWIAPECSPGWRVVKALENVTEEEINLVQCDIAERQVEVGSYEHRAEAVVIVMADRAHQRSLARGTPGPSIKFVCEDFRARQVAVKVPGIQAKSITRLFRDQVQRGHLSAEDAAATHLFLQENGRGPDVTAAEFADKRLKPLGRAGQPL